jgi:hypothetical protein
MQASKASQHLHPESPTQESLKTLSHQDTGLRYWKTWGCTLRQEAEARCIPSRVKLNLQIMCNLGSLKLLPAWSWGTWPLAWN